MRSTTSTAVAPEPQGESEVDQAHGPGAVDEAAVPEPNVDDIEAAYRARQRLDQRGVAQVDVLGQQDAARRRRHREVAAPPAVETPMAPHRSQRLPRPRRHSGQAPQYRLGSTATRSPTASWSTPRPMATTSPANSWPGTIGSEGANSPSRMWRSVPQMPHAATATTTSPSCGAGSSIVTTSTAPGPRDHRRSHGLTLRSSAPTSVEPRTQRAVADRYQRVPSRTSNRVRTRDASPRDAASTLTAVSRTWSFRQGSVSFTTATFFGLQSNVPFFLGWTRTNFELFTWSRS